MLLIDFGRQFEATEKDLLRNLALELNLTLFNCALQQVKHLFLFFDRPEGESFEILRENIKTEPKPVRGDVVTFSYDKYSQKSIPVNPVILRVRKDVTWEDVLENYANDSLALNGIVHHNSTSNSYL